MRKRQKIKSKAKQLSFFKKNIAREFGGALLKGNPKTARPLSTREPIHLVLKSAQAMGPRSMLHAYNSKVIDQIIRTHARLCQVRIYHLVNVGNHLHLVIKLDRHQQYAKFIRIITGLIARHVLKAQKGKKQASLENESNAKKTSESSHLVGNPRPGFWVARPFTRLIAWGRDYANVHQYMQKNRNDAKRCFVAWGFDVTDASAIQNLNTG